MADRKHASKRAAQNLSNNTLCTPNRTVKSKNSKCNTPEIEIIEKEKEKEVNMSEIHQMFATMMTKLEKLDGIETDMKEIKLSLEYAHAEITDLKEENEKIKSDQNKERERIQKLEEDNKVLRSKIVDLQARSMRDNLMFFNIPENEPENTTDIIHKILEEKMEIRDAQNTVKIDRSHRIGKKREGNQKPRPIVVKFNFYQDREYVRTHARKLKGTNIGISEQYPEEIESIRKTLYPELKKAKAEGKRAKIVRDKLIIDGRIFNNRS